MSAETLRRAAALMRERAEAATKGVPGGLGVAIKWSGLRSLAGRGLTANEAEHLATWSDPAVALAVADWLDECADIKANPDVNAVLKIALTDRALKVAAAYLGESA